MGPNTRIYSTRWLASNYLTSLNVPERHHGYYIVAHGAYYFVDPDYVKRNDPWGNAGAPPLLTADTIIDPVTPPNPVTLKPHEGEAPDTYIRVCILNGHGDAEVVAALAMHYPTLQNPLNDVKNMRTKLAKEGYVV